jgi:hypothetical protein
MSPVEMPRDHQIWSGVVFSAVSYCHGRPRTVPYKLAWIRIDPRSGLYTVNCIAAGSARTFRYPENSGAFYRLDRARKPGEPEFGEDSGNLTIGTTVERVIADGRKACADWMLASVDVALKTGEFVAQCTSATLKHIVHPFRVVSMLYLRINDPRHATISTVHADPRSSAVATNICKESDRRWRAAETIRRGDHYEITCRIVSRPKARPPFAYFLTRKVRHVQ